MTQRIATEERDISTCKGCARPLDETDAHFPHDPTCDGTDCLCVGTTHPECCWECAAGVDRGVQDLEAADHVAPSTQEITMQITELVGSADIADRTSVSRSAPGIWERRYDDFPARVATVNGVIGVWKWDEVEAWCRKTGRLPLEQGRIYDPRTGRDITEKAMTRRKAS